MTFIASVIAKNGVAIIADSLVTSIKPILEQQTFWDYVDSQRKNPDEKINLDVNEVEDLFQNIPSHTKDYEEKLFEYDKYTAITTAGSATINGRRIADIISELSDDKNHIEYNDIKEVVDDFCNSITSLAKEHIRMNGNIGSTSFIFTHYDKKKNHTTIYKIEVVQAHKSNLKDPDFKFVSCELQDEMFKVICDGQNRISERILFGDRNAVESLVPKVIKAVLQNFNIDEGQYSNALFQKVIRDGNIIDPVFMDDMKIFQLSSLSLQQAVDLACLLMRLEVDFQKYTKNIPTVGGVIKLAVIDKKGFRFIHGYDILKPDVI